MAKAVKVLSCGALACATVLAVVDQGLVGGAVGEPTPGGMCVEAAVAYSMGLAFNDQPVCVLPIVRDLKIEINDNDNWSGDAERAQGLRRVAIAQLGSDKAFTRKAFCKALNEAVLEHYVLVPLRQMVKDAPKGLRKELLRLAVAAYEKNPNNGEAEEFLRSAFVGLNDDIETRLCADNYPTKKQIAHSIGYAQAVWNACEDAGDAELSEFAEVVVGVLQQLKSPGAKWLWLTLSAKEQTKAQRKKAKALQTAAEARMAELQAYQDVKNSGDIS